MKHKTLDDEFPYGSHGKIQSELWLEQKEMQGQIWITGVHALLLKDAIFFSQEHTRVFIYMMSTSWTRSRSVYKES